jgi:hypothetical protein
MRMKEVIAAAAIPAMVASPAAAANPAASLSLRGDSNDSGGGATAASTAEETAQPDAVADVANGGISPTILLGGLAIVAVIIGAVALGSGHHGMRAASY